MNRLFIPAGLLFLIMFLLVLFKPDWIWGPEETFEPLPFAAAMEITDEPQERAPCIYYWRVEGLAHITRTLDSTSAGPYPVIPILVDVDFYPVKQVVPTEGLASREEILAKVQVPRPYMIGQWDANYPINITLVDRRCPYLPSKPDPETAVPNR